MHVLAIFAFYVPSSTLFALLHGPSRLDCVSPVSRLEPLLARGMNGHTGDTVTSLYLRCYPLLLRRALGSSLASYFALEGICPASSPYG